MRHARLTGILQLIESRSDLCSYEFYGDQPYPHRSHVKILAKPDDSTDQFIDSLREIEQNYVTIDALVSTAGDILSGADHIKAVEDLGARPGISELHLLAKHHRMG